MTDETAATNAAPEAIAPAPQVTESAPVAPDASAAPKPDGMSARIDELTRNWREAERREKALLAILQQDTPQPTETEAPAEQKLKTLADFEYDEVKYQSYLFSEARKVSAEAARKELQESQERESKARRNASFKSRQVEFAKTKPDYFDVAHNPALPITEAMAEAIEESEDGPALAYHLGKNLDVAAKIAQLPPVAAARELGRIEAQLAFEREKAAAAPKVTQAPPPPPKLEGTGDRVDKDPREMTQAEFDKWRGRYIAQRR